jgi:hypothetical protein
MSRPLLKIRKQCVPATPQQQKPLVPMIIDRRDYELLQDKLRVKCGELRTARQELKRLREEIEQLQQAKKSKSQ